MKNTTTMKLQKKTRKNKVTKVVCGGLFSHWRRQNENMWAENGVVEKMELSWNEEIGKGQGFNRHELGDAQGMSSSVKQMERAQEVLKGTSGEHVSEPTSMCE